MLRELFGLLCLHVSVYHISDYIFAWETIQTRYLHEPGVCVLHIFVNDHMYVYHGLPGELGDECLGFNIAAGLRLEVHYFSARSG